MVVQNLGRLAHWGGGARFRLAHHFLEVALMVWILHFLGIHSFNVEGAAVFFVLLVVCLGAEDVGSDCWRHCFKFLLGRNFHIRLQVIEVGCFI